MIHEKAIEMLKLRICCEKPIQHFCSDNCMVAESECEIAVAIKAIEKQIPKKPVKKRGAYKCPCCETLYFFTDEESKELEKYCAECGQALDWSGEK